MNLSQPNTASPLVWPEEPDVGGDLAALWPESERPAVDFVQHCSGQVPRASFFLRAGVRVIDSDLYLRRIREDLARGPSGPSAGETIRDCWRLRELFGRQVRRIPR